MQAGRRGGGDGGVGIGVIAQRNDGADLFGRWVDHVMVVGFGGGHPCAVDIEIAFLDHGFSPARWQRCGICPVPAQAAVAQVPDRSYVGSVNRK
jgi:hypothetical protein